MSSSSLLPPAISFALSVLLPRILRRLRLPPHPWFALSIEPCFQADPPSLPNPPSPAALRKLLLQHGYAVVRGVLSPAEVEETLELLWECVASPFISPPHPTPLTLPSNPPL